MQQKLDWFILEWHGSTFGDVGILSFNGNKTLVTGSEFSISLIIKALKT